MKFKLVYVSILAFVLLTLSVNASTLTYGSKTTQSVSGQTYSIQFMGYNSNTILCDFWVWKGTASSYTDTSERELAPSIGSGQSYNFVTFPLTLSVSSCGESSASYTLSASEGSPPPPPPSGCSDQCSNHYAYWCDGIYVKQCYYDSIGGCWKIGTKNSCTGDYTCQNGACVFVCPAAQCSFNGKQCYDGDVYNCVTDNMGCKVLQMVQNCITGSQICSNGQCVKNCIPHSYKNCYTDGNVWWVNSCDIFEGIADYCPSDTICSHGQCIPDCTANDHLGCYDNRPYWFDSCGIRGQALAPCDYNTEKCQDGACVKIYNDECQAGQIKCINDNQYQECVYMQTYSAYRWHPTAKNCGTDQRCVNDECVTSITSCPYECCLSGSGYYEKSCALGYECIGTRCSRKECNTCEHYANGVCVKNECCMDSDCGETASCNLQTGKCEQLNLNRCMLFDWECGKNKECVNSTCVTKCGECEYRIDNLCKKYECCDDYGCKDDEKCNLNAKKCEKLEVGECQYVKYHQIFDYECCSDEICGILQTCNNHQCENIKCECGEIVNRKCIEYECCKDADCGEGKICDPNIHKCIFQTGCLEVINNGAPEDKLDVLIVGAGYNDYSELKQKIEYLFDPSGVHNSFFSVEPYKSNFNKFNIWMLKAPNFRFEKTGDFWCGGDEFTPAEGLSEYVSFCPIADNTILISNENFRSYAYTCYGSSFDSLSCYSEDKQARLILHEFGHSFGCLSDEYIENGKRDDPGEPNCAPDLPTAKQWWGNFEGMNGVGYYTGVAIKGTTLDQLSGGCSYTRDNIRPTFNSIMRSQNRLEDDYGPVNEKWLSNKLGEFK